MGVLSQGFRAFRALGFRALGLGSRELTFPVSGLGFRV